MTDPSTLIARSRTLLETTRFITLATVSDAGEAWASTVNFVPLRGPLRLVWYSMRAARHSRNIDARRRIAGSIFRTDLGNLSPIGLDGAQCSGPCRVIPSEELSGIHLQYYERNFPDPGIRQAWMLPPAEFTDAGPRRFYELTVERWWLLDIDRWLIDKHDGRIEVSVADLSIQSIP